MSIKELACRKRIISLMGMSNMVMYDSQNGILMQDDNGDDIKLWCWERHSLIIHAGYTLFAGKNITEDDAIVLLGDDNNVVSPYINPEMGFVGKR